MIHSLQVKKQSYQRLHHFLSRHARPVEASPVGTTRSAVSPGQAAVPSGALWCPVLLTPQLAANITVGGVGAVDKLLSKNLLALLVQAVLGAWQLSW